MDPPTAAGWRERPRHRKAPTKRVKGDGIFEKYAARAHEVRLDDWERRPLGHRLHDEFVYTWHQLL